MSVQKRGGRPLPALVLILLILVILALPWIYLQFAAFPWDDYRTLAAENEYPFDYADFTDAGELTVRLDKADVYSLLLEYCPPEELLSEYAPAGLVKPELEELGFSLQPEEARVNLRLRALGFLHLPLQLRCALEEKGDGLRITPESVYIGPLLRVSAEKLAQRLGQPDLVRSYLISPGEYGAEGVTLRAGQNEVLLSVTVPSMLPDLLDLSVMRISRGLALYGVEDLPPATEAALGPGFTAAFQKAVAEGTAREFLTSYLAVGEEGVAQLLEEYTAGIPAGYLPDPEDVAAGRAAALEQLAAGQRKYETALETLRDLFHTGKLVPVPGGFQLDGRPLSLSDLGWTGEEPEDWRPVYLCSFQSAHPVQGTALPDADPEALPEGGVPTADLGLAMTFPHGEKILLYRTAGDELALIQLPEDSFRSILGMTRTPTLSTDEFPRQESWLLTEAPAADLMPVYYLLEG